MNRPLSSMFVIALLAFAACHRRAERPTSQPPAEADVPIACRLDALTPAERTRQAALRHEVTAAVAGIDEMADGYRLRFADDPAVLGRLAEWIPLERRCCPFLSFEIVWPAGAVGPALVLRGRPGVKEFLAAEIAGT